MQATVVQKLREQFPAMVIYKDPASTNSLFAGRHILVNRAMLAGSGLDALCRIADTPEEMIAACHQLMQQPIDAQSLRQREFNLLPAFSNRAQGLRLKEMLP